MLSKEETKEIIELTAACSGLMGYLSALEDKDCVTDAYITRLKQYYIVSLRNAVKPFIDKMGMRC